MPFYPYCFCTRLFRPVRPRAVSCRRILGLWLLATALGLAGCGPSGYSEQEYLERAIEFEQSGDLAASAIELKNTLLQNPQNAEARWRLGSIYLSRGEAEAALAELNRARDFGWDAAEVMLAIARAHELSGDHQAVLDALESSRFELATVMRDVHVMRGRALLELERLDAADSEFEAARALDPHYAPALTGLAKLHLLRSDVDSGRALLNSALELAPDHAEAWRLLAHLERALGHLAEAEQAYTAFIEHAPVPYAGLYNRALLRIGRGELDGAREDLRAMDRAAGEFPLTHYVRGLLHLQDRDFIAASEDFDTVLRHYPAYAPALFHAGLAHFGRGNWKQAEQYLNRLLQTRPRVTTATRILADVRRRRGDVEGAGRLLEDLLRSNPEDITTLDSLAELYLSLDQADAALGPLEHLVSLRPDSAQTRARLATALLQVGETDRSFSELEVARELEPEAESLDVAMVKHYLRIREYHQALKEAERLAEKQPDRALPHTLVGLALMGLERIDEATQAFDTALGQEPGDFLATRNLALIAMHEGSVNRARQRFETALEHRPDGLELLLELANFEAHQGNVERTHELVLRAVEEHPEALQPRLVLARYYVNTGEPNRALSVLEPMADLYPNNPDRLEVLARAQREAGRTELAVNSLRELVRLLPEIPEAHYQLGVTHQQAGRLREARRALDRALELEPRHVRALQSLIRIELDQQHPEIALGLARRLQSIEGEQISGLLLEGEAELARSEMAAAVSAYQAAYQQAPSAEVALQLHYAYRQGGDLTSGIELLTRQLERDPADDRIRLALGSAFQEQGAHRSALEHLEILMHRHPENYVIANNLAFSYFQVDDERALKMARRARELQPDDPQVQGTLGLILWAHGDHEEALPLLREAHEALPDNPTMHFYYARALADTGQRANARISLSELLASERSFPEEDEARVLLQSLR